MKELKVIQSTTPPKVKNSLWISPQGIKHFTNKGWEKSGNNNGGGSAAELAVNTTWSKLKAMRDNSQLTVGCLYRITDYETIISGEDVQSAGHVFDIIVLATDVNVLSEDAMAVHSARDTEGYFASSKLEAWELKYCLDNDQTRFTWAGSAGSWFAVLENDIDNTIILDLISENDTTYEGYPYKFTAYNDGMQAELYIAHLELQNGEEIIPNIFVAGGEVMYNEVPITSIEKSNSTAKGVIWNMTDEYNNSCGYDFKNVQFKRYKITATKENPSENECAFFNKYAGLLTYNDSFPKLPNGYIIDENDSIFLYTFSYIDIDGSVKDNSIGGDFMEIGMSISLCRNNIMDPAILDYFYRSLNNNVFITTLSDSPATLIIVNNKLGLSCYNNTFVGTSQQNTLGEYCYEIVLGNSSFNVFDNGCKDITLGNNCQGNIFTSACDGIRGGNMVLLNIFEGCAGIRLGNNSMYNKFANFCSNIILGNYTVRNIISNGVRYVTLEDNVENTQVLSMLLNSMQVINFTPNANYTQIAGLDSQGNLKIWNPADLVQ
jgi:hypothetical protein